MAVDYGDIIRVRVTAPDLAFLRAQAEQTASGGTSRLRSGEDRKAKLLQDQLVGHIGQWAGTLALFGDDRPYRLSRWFNRQLPRGRGDGGVDIPGSNIDIKASLIPRGSDPLSYRLAVRPAELHKGGLYVLALVHRPEGEVTLGEAAEVEALVMGWATPEMLKLDKSGGPFDGAHTCWAEDLHPLPPIRWAA